MDSTIFLAISICIFSAWVYLNSSRKSSLSKSITQAALLVHSLYFLYYILVDPPRNVFHELGLPPDTPADALRALYLRKSYTGDLDPELDRLLKKLNSFDVRTWYFQLGHDAIAGCDYCHTFEEYILFAFVRPVLAYILEVAFVGALTLPNTTKGYLRSFGIGVLIISLLIEVTLTLTARITLSPTESGQYSLMTKWHGSVDLARSALFLLLPLSLHLPRIPFIYNIPLLSTLLPTPDLRLNLPPPAQRLQTLQHTLDHLLTRLHLLTYTRAAIMRLPETRERAASWWDAEGREGKAVLEDEGVVRTAKGMGLAYGEPEGVLRANARKGLESVFSGVLPSEHWVKEGPSTVQRS